MKHTAVLLLFILSSFSSERYLNQFPNDEEKMEWSASRPLTWNDFRGTPNPVADFVATTNSGMSFTYSYSIRNGSRKINFEVKSYFYPNSSWYIKKDVSPYILKHEQTHFDISELHARKLRKRLDGTTFSDNLKPEIEAIYRKVEEERKATQDAFDTESDHSKNKAGEVKWEGYIAQQLAVYNDWQ